MCLYPKLILNRKYCATKKNNYNPPICSDQRVKYVPVGCGNCIECRRQKARAWQVRLHEELKSARRRGEHAYFITLSFAPEELEELLKSAKSDNVNIVAAKAVRRFTERWRKKYKKTIKHWLITELGHTNTERIHIHGIIFTDKPNEEITSMWKYGNTYIGEYCNEKTINYVVKYVTKIDTDHKTFEGAIFSSKGIGAEYMKHKDAEQNKYKPNGTREFYRLPTGQKINLPIYYRNHIYTEEEREKLWVEKLEKQERYILGQKIDISTEQGEEEYYTILKEAQKDNERLNYGTDGREWKHTEYRITRKMLKNAL